MVCKVGKGVCIETVGWSVRLAKVNGWCLKPVTDLANYELVNCSGTTCNAIFELLAMPYNRIFNMLNNLLAMQCPNCTQRLATKFSICLIFTHYSLISLANFPFSSHYVISFHMIPHTL